MKELIETYVEKHLDIIALAVSVLVLNFLLGLNFQSIVVLILIFLSIKLLHLRLFDKSSYTHDILVNTTLLITLTLSFILNKYCFFLFVAFTIIFILTAIFSVNIKICIDSVFFTFLSLFCLWVFLKPYNISIVKSISSLPYAYMSCIVWTSLLGLILIFLSDNKFHVLSLLLIRQFAIFFSIYYSYFFDKSILSYVIIACDIYLFYYFLRLLTSSFLVLLKLNRCVINIILSFIIIISFPLIIYWSIFGYESDMRKIVHTVSNKASIEDIFVTDNKKLAMVYMFYSKLHCDKHPKILYIGDVLKDFQLLDNSKHIFMTTQNKVPFRKIWKLEKLQGVFKTYSYDSNDLSNDDKIIELCYFFSNNTYFYNKFPEKYKIAFDDIPIVPIGENIIYNSSFEFDLNGWKYSGPAGPTFNTLYDETNNFYFLKWALNTRAKHWAYLEQNIYLITGLYEMKFDLKAYNHSSYDNVNFHLVLTTPYGNRIYLTSSNINTEWKTFSKTFSLVEEGYCTLSLMFSGKWNSVIDIKDIQLIRME